MGGRSRIVEESPRLAGDQRASISPISIVMALNSAAAAAADTPERLIEDLMGGAAGGTVQRRLPGTSNFGRWGCCSEEPDKGPWSPARESRSPSPLPSFRSRRRFPGSSAPERGDVLKRSEKTALTSAFEPQMRLDNRKPSRGFGIESDRFRRAAHRRDGDDPDRLHQVPGHQRDGAGRPQGRAHDGQPPPERRRLPPAPDDRERARPADPQKPGAEEEHRRADQGGGKPRLERPEELVEAMVHEHAEVPEEAEEDGALVSQAPARNGRLRPTIPAGRSDIGPASSRTRMARPSLSNAPKAWATQSPNRPSPGGPECRG